MRRHRHSYGITVELLTGPIRTTAVHFEVGHDPSFGRSEFRSSRVLSSQNHGWQEMEAASRIALNAASTWALTSPPETRYAVLLPPADAICARLSRSGPTPI